MPRKERFDELRIATAPVAGESPVRLRDVDGLNLQTTGDVDDGGLTEAVGDGTTTTFEWATTATDPIQWTQITPTTEAASADHHVDAGAGTVTVEYATAPPASEPLGWFWAVGGSSDTTATDDKATKLARYITIGDESEDLPDSVTHANITQAGDLHRPKAHGDAAHLETYLKPEDGSNFAAALHGDVAHSETYLKPADIAGKADDPHGNETHSSNFATTADISGKANSPHGNEAHSSEYATTTAVSGKADDPHGDASHDATVPSATELSSHASSTGDVHGIAATDSVAAQSEVDKKAPLNGGGTADLASYDTISANTITADNISGGGSTAESPVYDVTEYGATGGDTSDDTSAVSSAISAAEAAGGGTVYFPPGTFHINTEFVIPTGVEVRGAGTGATTIRSTDTASTISFQPNSQTAFGGFVMDQNAAGRSHRWTTGIRIQDCNNVLVENIRFINLSTDVNGSGVFFEAEETDSQDCHSHLVRNCYFRGDNQNGDNGGDFLIRARTAFGSSLEADQFTRFLRDVRIDNCYFTGAGKSAIEFVGPATRQNLITNCVARDFTTCVGVFEFSLGAKDSTAANCYIVDSYADSHAMGFLSDGWQGGTPNRRSEDNSFVNCHVRNYQQLQLDNNVQAFRTRLDDRTKFVGCSVKDVSAPTQERAYGFDISQSTNVTVDSPRIVNVYRGFRINGATLPRINTPFLHNISNPVYEETAPDRPRWNGILGGGEFGGVDLSTSSGYFTGDKGVHSATMLQGIWNGTAWKMSDGSTI